MAGELPATEEGFEGRATTAPETAADGEHGVAGMVTNAMERVVRTLS